HATRWLSVLALVTHLPLHDATLHRQLVNGTRQGLFGRRLVRVAQLEHDATGLDVCDPPFRRTFTGTHAGFGRLLRQWPVRVDVDPDLATTLDVSGHGDTRGLDLPVRDVGRLQCLDAVLAERDTCAALGDAASRRVMLLAVLDPPGNQHRVSSPLPSRQRSPRWRCPGSRPPARSPRPLW